MKKIGDYIVTAYVVVCLVASTACVGYYVGKHVWKERKEDETVIHIAKPNF